MFFFCMQWSITIVMKINIKLHVSYNALTNIHICSHPSQCFMFSLFDEFKIEIDTHYTVHRMCSEQCLKQLTDCGRHISLRPSVRLCVCLCVSARFEKFVLPSINMLPWVRTKVFVALVSNNYSYGLLEKRILCWFEFISLAHFGFILLYPFW